jgi:hypothetical protein
MPESAPSKRGGARPGAGRPPQATVRIFATVKRSTAATLERMAKAKGLTRKRTTPFYGSVIDDIASLVTTEEPEYLKLARAVRA